MIPWQVTWAIIILFIPLGILFIWTVLPLGKSTEKIQKKRWDKKWKKMYPELYEEEENARKN